MIIDEAHHFRNPGIAGTRTTCEPSRYYQLYDLLDRPSGPRRSSCSRPRRSTTADDFRHMAELFTRRDEAYFARTWASNNLRAHFNQMEKALRERVAADERRRDVGRAHVRGAARSSSDDRSSASSSCSEAGPTRARARSAKTGKAGHLPRAQGARRSRSTRSARPTAGCWTCSRTPSRKRPRCSPCRCTTRWPGTRGSDKSIDPFEENRQKQVVGLIRTNFLKRFESSVVRVRALLRPAAAEAAGVPRGPQRDRRREEAARALEDARTPRSSAMPQQRQLEFWGEDGEESEDEDIVPQEMLDAVEQLDREEYDVAEMMAETFLDLDQIVQFLAEARKFEPKHDDKLQKLIRLLKSKELRPEGLIFTEFADTARYLDTQLEEAGIDGVARSTAPPRATGPTSSSASRPTTTASSSADVAEKGREEIRVLISTDVLSEGLNLQDASRMINYDIHWNPVRLMQRIGRVDRRMNPEVEERLDRRPPGGQASRGKVSFWNFLPPDELNAILTLYTQGHPEDPADLQDPRHRRQEAPDARGRLRGPQGVQPRLRGHQDRRRGHAPRVPGLLQADPALEARLEGLPGATVQRPRSASPKGARGVFFCYALRRRCDKRRSGEFTEEAGTTRWYLYDLDRDAILEEAERDRRQHPLQARHPAQVHDRAEDPRRASRQDREAHQEHLPEARGRAGGRQAGAQVLDGTERGLSRCRPTTAPSSPNIKRFDQLIAYLRDEMGWPIARDSFEDVDDLFYDFTPDELGIDPKTAAKIQEIKRLRPLSPNQPWGIFFVKFEPKRLPVVALRRILSQVALKKRASANSAERAAWAADDLLFVSNYGEGDERQISFAHFSQAAGRPRPADPQGARLGQPRHGAAPRRRRRGADASTWPGPTTTPTSTAWRKQWRAAFTLRHREVITTSKELSIRLAELARAIRDRIKTALAIETDDGPLTKLMKAFQEALVHDLDADGFADMYAQTIAYGLLSARIADPHKKTADDFAAHMRTNPFLRELMETFLKVGGRRGKAGGPGIDFDELGVSEVVELLDDANMEAVVRDFGDRNPQEDPVIHFYELFLKEYDAKKRMQRGVFYTPRPVVSYIVRSVDELLRTEFGLEDGLADTTTWGEMAKRHKDLKIPEGVSPDQDFRPDPRPRHRHRHLPRRGHRPHPQDAGRQVEGAGPRREEDRRRSGTSTCPSTCCRACTATSC